MALLNLFKKPEPASNFVVSSCADLVNVPTGFCRVLAGGRETIGYRNQATGFWCPNIGTTLTVNDGKQVTLKPQKGKSLAETIASLPLVKITPLLRPAGAAAKDGMRKIAPGVFLVGDWS